MGWSSFYCGKYNKKIAKKVPYLYTKAFFNYIMLKVKMYFKLRIVKLSIE